MKPEILFHIKKYHKKYCLHFYWCLFFCIFFRYRKEEDGYYRLQTTRFESVELEAQLDQEESPSSVCSDDTMQITGSPCSQTDMKS